MRRLWAAVVEYFATPDPHYYEMPFLREVEVHEDVELEFEMGEGQEWGADWTEITALGDEYRRFRKPNGKVVEVPFGEHVDEEGT